jgi:Clostripain family
MARRQRRSLPKKPWAFLAYIAGDNNLSDAGLEDIQEMCDVGSSSAVHAAVQIDTKGAFDGVVRYEISQPDPTGVAHRIVIERLAELDSGDPDTLRDSLRWGFTRYPARKRVVVVWNHGAGFRTRLPRRDIAYDDSGTELDMNEIDGVFDDLGIGPTRRISILGFDACLMNMIEIAHHLRRRAEYIVGSEQTEPGDGWPYENMLAILNKNLSTATTARKIVSTYIQSYRKAGEQNVTHRPWTPRPPRPLWPH